MASAIVQLYTLPCSSTASTVMWTSIVKIHVKARRPVSHITGRTHTPSTQIEETVKLWYKIYPHNFAVQSIIVWDQAYEVFARVLDTISGETLPGTSKGVWIRLSAWRRRTFAYKSFSHLSLALWAGALLAPGNVSPDEGIEDHENALASELVWSQCNWESLALYEEGNNEAGTNDS